MVKLKRPLGGVGANPDHELAAHDAGEHVPSQEEGKAAEHLAFGHFGVGGHDLASAVGEVLVVGHQASRRPGRSKKQQDGVAAGGHPGPTATSFFRKLALSQRIYCAIEWLY